MTRIACPLLSMVVILALPVLAQKYEGMPVKSGQATATYGGKAMTFTHAEGGLQQMSGFTTATLVFRPDAKSKGEPHLNITVMYQGPGKVDLDSAFSMSGISMFVAGDVARFTKRKSTCTVTLTKATPTELEGAVDCPVLHNIAGEVMPALTVQKFSATTR